MTARTEPSGHIIILNGTSSSGKSTLAKELQRTLSGYTLHTGIDLFAQMVPEGFDVVSDGTDPAAAEGVLWVRNDDGTRVTEMRLGPKAIQLKESMYRAAQAMAGTGFNVIVDDVVLDSRTLAIMCRLLAGDAYFVGVHCPLPVAIRREAERGDRPLGLVETQFDLVHRHGVYDVTVDTHANTPDECAAAVRQVMAAPNRPEALASLERAHRESR